MTHADALRLRLSNERSRLTSAKNQSERSLREVWVAQIEKELSDELRLFPVMSDDELLAELSQ